MHSRTPTQRFEQSHFQIFRANQIFHFTRSMRLGARAIGMEDHWADQSDRVTNA